MVNLLKNRVIARCTACGWKAIRAGIRPRPAEAAAAHGTPVRARRGPPATIGYTFPPSIMPGGGLHVKSFPDEPSNARSDGPIRQRISALRHLYILDVYERPYDPRRPRVGLDEKLFQLLANVRQPRPVRPGQARRTDDEHGRRGTANAFVAVEPLGGRRFVQVTARRTAADFAKSPWWLVMVKYKAASTVALVTDNLNTHMPGAIAPCRSVSLGDGPVGPTNRRRHVVNPLRRVVDGATYHDLACGARGGLVRRAPDGARGGCASFVPCPSSAVVWPRHLEPPWRVTYARPTATGYRRGVWPRHANPLWWANGRTSCWVPAVRRPSCPPDARGSRTPVAHARASVPRHLRPSPALGAPGAWHKECRARYSGSNVRAQFGCPSPGARRTVRRVPWQRLPPTC